MLGKTDFAWKPLRGRWLGGVGQKKSKIHFDTLDGFSLNQAADVRMPRGGVTAIKKQI
jgi:hypothetical protein